MKNMRNIHLILASLKIMIRNEEIYLLVVSVLSVISSKDQEVHHCQWMLLPEMFEEISIYS